MAGAIKPCSVCTHPRQPEISAALAAHIPYSRVAEMFGVSGSALSRHKRHAAASEAPAPRDVVRMVDHSIADLRTLSTRARKNRDGKAAVELGLKISRELRMWVSLRAQLQRHKPIAAGDHDDLDAEQLAAIEALMPKETP